MGAGKVLAFLGGILTLVGTYIFALFEFFTSRGSGLGFAMNLPDLFKDAESWASLMDISLTLFYIYLVLFIIFLASGVLQMLSIRSRAVGFIFSLFPFAVSLMFILLVYTDILGTTSAFFTIFFVGEEFSEVFPFLVPIGDLALGVYLLLAGGILGMLSAFIEREP